MDEIRQAWGIFLARAFNFLVDAWTRFYEGITSDWNVRTFIMVMSIAAVLSGITMWRRRV